jgi:integrase
LASGELRNSIFPHLIYLFPYIWIGTPFFIGFHNFKGGVTVNKKTHETRFSDGSPGLEEQMDSAQMEIKDILKAYNLPGIRFHDFKHTNASLMLKNAISAKIISSVHGHSTW